MPGPLEGMRVLDLTTEVAGPYATKLLADFGADVVKIEPPGGDPSRREGPFFHDEPHPEGSGRFLHLNTNKRSVVLDLQVAAEREHLTPLVRWCDVLIEDFAPGVLSGWGLGFEQLRALSPGLVLVSLTPWGQSGPYAGYRQSDLVAQAMGGPMLWTGSGEREPLKLGGPLAHYQAGAVSALAAAMAFYRRERLGAGDHVDVSIYETQAGSRDRVTPYVTNYSYSGNEPVRRASGSSFLTGVRPCIDGYVNIQARGLDRFLPMIGRGELLGDKRLALPPALLPPDFFADVEASYLGWLMQRTKREAVAEAQAAHALAGPVNTPADLLSDPHFRDRGVWETIDHPHTGPIEYPGRPFVMSASPRPPAKRAPQLGEHTAELLAAPPPARSQPAAAAPSDGAAPLPLPLDGVRVIDVTVVWAGPYGAQLLAEWGAEVIRVEPIARLQPGSRAGVGRRTTRAQQMQLRAQAAAGAGGFPDQDPGDDPWNRGAAFNAHARNKRSVTADISTAEGRELFYRLVAHADVVIENNVPETIEKAQITYERLREINPRLIMLRMPGFGLAGPYKNYRAFGTHIEGMIGHHYLRGYPEGTPDEAGDVFTGDALAGIQGALAVTMALRHRERTGEGQQIELAQAENFMPLLSEQLLEWTMNGVDRGPQGNRHRSHAPHQAYPCKGEEQWIAIDVATDEEFAQLCWILGGEALADDPEFATMDARLAHLERLDREIGLLTRGFDKFWLFHRLQAAGIAAGPLPTMAERFQCPQLQSRGFYEYLDGSSTGRQWYPGLIWRMASTPNWLRRPPPRLGEDNAHVYRDLLGMSEAEYQQHVASGQIGWTYAPSAFG